MESNQLISYIVPALFLFWALLRLYQRYRFTPQEKLGRVGKGIVAGFVALFVIPFLLLGLVIWWVVPASELSSFLSGSHQRPTAYTLPPSCSSIFWGKNSCQGDSDCVLVQSGYSPPSPIHKDLAQAYYECLRRVDDSGARQEPLDFSDRTVVEAKCIENKCHAIWEPSEGQK